MLADWRRVEELLLLSVVCWRKRYEVERRMKSWERALESLDVYGPGVARLWVPARKCKAIPQRKRDVRAKRGVRKS